MPEFASTPDVAVLTSAEASQWAWVLDVGHELLAQVVFFLPLVLLAYAAMIATKRQQTLRDLFGLLRREPWFVAVKAVWIAAAVAWGVSFAVA